MKKFTKEEIMLGIVKPLCVGLAFGLAQVKDDEAKTIIAEVKDGINEAIDSIDLTNAPNVDDVIGAAITVAKTISSHTDSEADDKAVEIAEIAEAVKKGDVTAFTAFFKVIGLFHKIKIAEKADASAEVKP